ncbi:MAG: Gfo/Idh/MocA family oxidoreductase [Sphingobacteriales bacterium]|nr:Gfo/Idh/MocA family oxidoreductase [Sphingobacteriales bacterium]OJY90170.1 MAG: acetylgalactosaminidase [Sphingobacteriales bacterium 44-15]
MNNNRRSFLKMAGLLSTGMASGPLHGFSKNSDHNAVSGAGTNDAQLFNMCGYRAPKIDTVRIGFAGLGNRGSAAVKRISHIDGISINGLCDIRPERVQQSQAAIKSLPYKPALYSASGDDYKKMCEREDIDVVYIATPWNLHVPIAVYAMNHGKHVCIEVGNAESIEECWQLVNASEKNKKHCIFLENCCYDFFELLTLNMARQGYFGDIVHCEGAYIHTIEESLFDVNARYNLWRLRENAKGSGNLYPTHGLGPICQVMNINRGDQLDYLVSVSGNDFTLHHLEEEAYKKDPATFKPFLNAGFRGNMNTSVIKTMKGKTIMLQHDVSSPRVYSRIHLISGTKGSALKYPLPGKIANSHEGWLSEDDMKKLEDTYTLPIVKRLGEMAKQVGGHGGMDFLMDWRWIDCLRNGLPVDNDVYDAALWTSIGPLSKWSAAHRSASIDVPDFTRGAWKKNKPVELSIDHENLTGVKA